MSSEEVHYRKLVGSSYEGVTSHDNLRRHEVKFSRAFDSRSEEYVQLFVDLSKRKKFV